MLIFKGLRVREIYPKIIHKSQNIHEQQCLEMLSFLYSFFSRLFLDLVSILAPFSSSEDNFGAVQIDSFQETGPRGSKAPFALILAPKVLSKRPLGSILAPSGLLLVMFGKVWGRFLEGFGAQPSAQKYAVRCTLYAERCTLYAVRRTAL